MLTGPFRPVTRPLTPGQDGDCPRFISLMGAIRIGRRGRGWPRNFGKRELMDQGTVDVASIRIWLRDPSHDQRDTPYP